MPKLDVTHKQSVEVSPLQLANMFLDCDAHQQAEFFTHIANSTKDWKSPFCFQLADVCDSPMLTPEGRAVMIEIGEYATEAAPNLY